MTYDDTLKYLYNRLPMFQRVGAAAYKADLRNTVAVCRMLGNPERDFPAVHIAGTNGKGSTANMIASVLQEAGFKTALFTSPHLKDFRERIRVNGQMVPREYVVDFVAQYAGEAEKTGASFFELTFGMAMKYFSDSQVDIAVVEVGMGGRLDSTNVVNPLVTAITNISFDHTAFLGNTLSEIAVEKAGIIKNGVPVVIGRYQHETNDVFVKKAEEKNAPLFYSHKLVGIKESTWLSYSINNNGYQNIDLPLKGKYQIENLRTAIAVLLLLSANKKFNNIVDKDVVFNGIKNVERNTHFAGRWQTLGKNPMIICDTGHNEDGLSITMHQLKELEFNKLRMVIGVVNDKEISKILSLFPTDATYYFCKADIPRALNPYDLWQQAQNFGFNGKIYNTVKDALHAAKQDAGKDDLIFVGGSTFVVAEALE